MLKRLDTEINKFKLLCQYADHPLPMFSRFIDQYWHTLIASDQNISPCLVHDTSIFSISPVKVQWISAYEKEYGLLDSTWFMTASGNVIKETYLAYLANRYVISAFNCAGRIQ